MIILHFFTVDHRLTNQTLGQRVGFILGFEGMPTLMTGHTKKFSLCIAEHLFRRRIDKIMEIVPVKTDDTLPGRSQDIFVTMSQCLHIGDTHFTL